MIRSIILSFFITTFYFGSIQAQNYKRFIEPNKYWDVSRFIGPGICITDYNRYFFIDNTVIINNQRYNQLAVHPMIYDSGAPPFCMPLGYNRDTTRLSIYFREDTLNQEVYRLEPGAAVDEQLWFKFNKEVGDSVSIIYCDLSTSERLILSDIEIIPDQYGVSRRTYMFNASTYSGGLIEGIGYDLADPFYGYCPLAADGGTVCVFYDDVPENNWQCFGFITSSNQLYSTVISIYPNPVSDKLFIDNMEQAFWVKIYNMNGLPIYSNIASVEEGIDLSKFSSGIYLVKILDKKNRLLYSKRIVKL